MEENCQRSKTWFVYKVEIYDFTLKEKILWNGTAWVNLDGTSLEESTALNNIEEIPASQDTTY